jgi:hypothetical protein
VCVRPTLPPAGKAAGHKKAGEHQAGPVPQTDQAVPEAGPPPAAAPAEAPPAAEFAAAPIPEAAAAAAMAAAAAGPPLPADMLLPVAGIPMPQLFMPSQPLAATAAVAMPAPAAAMPGDAAAASADAAAAAAAAAGASPAAGSAPSTGGEAAVWEAGRRVAGSSCLWHEETDACMCTPPPSTT